MKLDGNWVENVENNKSKLRCVAISDIHGYLEKPENMPQGDVLCICGDIVPLDYQNDLVQSVAWFCLEFVPWTDSLPYKKVIFIAGNHDFFLQELQRRKTSTYVDADGAIISRFSQRSPSEVLKKLLPGNNKSKHKLIYLCDNSVEIDGKRFYGTPWISDLQRWAFYLPEEELSTKWKNIPGKVDVLMTHMSPKYEGVGTVLQRGQFNSGTDYGSDSLAKNIIARDIKYTISGHVHSGQHKPVEYLEGRYMANVSIKNEDYKKQYYPLEFEI